MEQLLSLAGGVQDGAFLDAVEIRRTSVLNNRAEVVVLNQDLSEARGLSLEPGDELRINFIPGWAQRDVVRLDGEVVFPGDYTLRPGETVGSLIERAGGFTDAAFIESTRYLSKVARERQTQSVQKIINQLRKAASSQSLGDSGIASQGNLEYLDQLDDNIEGRVVIDLPRILAGDAGADIALQDGDEIIVPKATSAVFLVGEVLEPGNYRHVEGRSVEDYIGLAAGYSATAKKKDVYVIEPNGRVRRVDEKGGLLSFNDRRALEISPGSTIVIPPNLDYTKPLDLYSQVSSVVFQSLASVAAFFNIARN
jgi:protein involved in polysaccharide export with SLBB domain